MGVWGDFGVGSFGRAEGGLVRHLRGVLFIICFQCSIFLI